MFLKLGFGKDLEEADLATVDSEAWERKVLYLRERRYAERDGLSFEDLSLSFSYTDNPLHPAHKHYYDTQYGDADTETDAVAESDLAVDNL